MAFSGCNKPKRSTACWKRSLSSAASISSGKVPIIGVGGIMNASDGEERINEGAELIQIYSGLIFKGYRLIHELCERTQQE